MVLFTEVWIEFRGIQEIVETSSPEISNTVSSAPFGLWTLEPDPPWTHTLSLYLEGKVTLEV